MFFLFLLIIVVLFIPGVITQTFNPTAELGIGIGNIGISQKLKHNQR